MRGAGPSLNGTPSSTMSTGRLAIESEEDSREFGPSGAHQAEQADDLAPVDGQTDSR